MAARTSPADSLEVQAGLYAVGGSAEVGAVTDLELVDGKDLHCPIVSERLHGDVSKVKKEKMGRRRRR